jgi:hypothetical protein
MRMAAMVSDVIPGDAQRRTGIQSVWISAVDSRPLLRCVGNDSWPVRFAEEFFPCRS